MTGVTGFAAFDRRGYPTVGVVDGYGEWAASYEETVRDEMDLALLDALTSVAWDGARAVADLGCGTGRTAAWLRARGAGADGIDGVDLTPAMLERAASRGLFRTLARADVRASGLGGGLYDLVTTVLVDEHLPDLAPLYAEAARLARPGGAHVVVGIHPFFLIASGMPTHFDRPGGDAVAIDTHVHLLSAHVAAATAAGLVLAELREAVIDDAWVRLKPRWAEQRGQPISYALVWRRCG